jgi:hypothetical protein
MRLPALLLAALLLSGCAETTAPDNVQEAVQAATEAVAGTIEQADDIREQTAPQVSAVTLGLREAVEAVTPEPLPTVVDTSVNPAVVALVVRWEVGSPKQYTAKYQGVICPGGASGPTIGIGDDLGHQTPNEIRRRWGWHPQVERMVTGSGQTGPAACNAWKKAHADIRVTYAEALRIFQTYAWPKYAAMASRAYRKGWDGLTTFHQDSLTSNGYNRGFSFLGSKRSELVVIRDNCVPRSAADCTADQLRASCRVWDSQPTIRKGLCARRHAEADFAVRTS